MRRTVGPATGPLTGTLRVPGDKSISHRALLFAAMAEGTSELQGVLASADVRATVQAVTALGARVEIVGLEEEAPPAGGRFRVTGWGERGPSAPYAPIDCGNSGTTARLLAGVLAGWGIEVRLVGDESLSTRPMMRVTEPLTAMGAAFETAMGGTLPMKVRGGGLHGIEYEMPVASAQVKSAVLLAGLRAEGRTTVHEPAPSRDHTERLLPAFGAVVGRDEAARTCWVDGPATLSCADVRVGGDPSSAAFFAGAAAIVPGSRISLIDVGLNPTRIGFARVLEEMGAALWLEAGGEAGEEPTGTVRVEYSDDLHGTTVVAEQIPSLIDEIPLLAVVATQARGTTRFEGVRELRVKETDRLAAIGAGLGGLGAVVRSGEDWLEVDGPTALRSCSLWSGGDHRLAMAWAVAALVADGPVEIDGWEAIDVSYPRFGEDLVGVQGG